MILNIKSILLGTLASALSVLNPPAAKELNDAQAALADGHLSEDEGKLLVSDTIATVKSLWPEGAQVCDDLKVNLEVDAPNIEKTFTDIHALTAAKPATA